MSYVTSIEGIPFIIRFKTKAIKCTLDGDEYCIEGIPFIIRFKTIRRSVHRRLHKSY